MTLLGGFEPPIYRLTAGRLNHWATEAWIIQISGFLCGTRTRESLIRKSDC